MTAPATAPRSSSPRIFHEVVAFRGLAENAAASLAKGMAVTVTGQFADNSYVPDGSDRVVRRIRPEATDLAVSLRWATAEVTKRTTGERRAAKSVEEPELAAAAS